MISLSTPKEQLGTAFGVHRALDTTGALLGPLVAFGLLAWRQTAFDARLPRQRSASRSSASAVLLLFVQNPRAEARVAEVVELAAGKPAAAARRAALPRARPSPEPCSASRRSSDGFVYLGLQQKLDFEPAMFPLLFVGTASVFMVLAVPMGRLADRVGRTKVFLGGYLPAARRLRAPARADVGWRPLVLATRRCSGPSTPPPTAS